MWLEFRWVIIFGENSHAHDRSGMIFSFLIWVSWVTRHAVFLIETFWAPKIFHDLSHLSHTSPGETFWAPIISPYGFSTYLSWYWTTTCSEHIYVDQIVSQRPTKHKQLLYKTSSPVFFSLSHLFHWKLLLGTICFPGYFLPLRLHEDLEGSLQSTDLVSNFVTRFQNNHILLLYRWEVWDNCSSHKTWILQKTLTLPSTLYNSTSLFLHLSFLPALASDFLWAKVAPSLQCLLWTARWIAISGRATGNKAVSVVDGVDLTEFPWTWLGLSFSKSCF